MPKDEFAAEDPLELVGIVLPGEVGQLEAMAEAIVEEYIRMGWEAGRLMALFRNPMFLATHRIYRQKGEAYVQDLIYTMCSKWNLSAGSRIPQRTSASDEGRSV